MWYIHLLYWFVSTTLPPVFLHFFLMRNSGFYLFFVFSSASTKTLLWWWWCIKKNKFIIQIDEISAIRIYKCMMDWICIVLYLKTIQISFLFLKKKSIFILKRNDVFPSINNNIWLVRQTRCVAFHCYSSLFEVSISRYHIEYWDDRLNFTTQVNTCLASGILYPPTSNISLQSLLPIMFSVICVRTLLFNVFSSSSNIRHFFFCSNIPN